MPISKRRAPAQMMPLLLPPCFFRVSMLYYLQKSEPFVGFFVLPFAYWLQALVLPSFYIGQTGSNHSLVWSCLVIFYRLEQVGNVSVTI